MQSLSAITTEEHTEDETYEVQHGSLLTVDQLIELLTTRSAPVVSVSEILEGGNENPIDERPTHQKEKCFFVSCKTDPEQSLVKHMLLASSGCLKKVIIDLGVPGTKHTHPDDALELQENGYTCIYLGPFMLMDYPPEPDLVAFQCSSVIAIQC